MAATRTQIYLTRQQRDKLDVLAADRGTTLANVIRDAIDAFLTEDKPDIARALADTFGKLPDLDLPSRNEWNRSNG